MGYGFWLKTILVEADSRAESGDDLWSAVREDLWSAVGEAGPNIYKRGDFKESQMADLDVYLLKKVSALITSEFYTRDQFPGFGRPFVFNSEVQKRFTYILICSYVKKVYCKKYVKNDIFFSQNSYWGILEYLMKYIENDKEEAAELAGWEDEQIEFIREKVSEEGKQDDLKKGKAPEQVVLDEAAFLMDLATVDGNWDEVVDRIADCYREAGIHDIAQFIAYRE
ncbi:hypothetical protein TRIUR3_03534 [Triticum urartu]|uniref:Uncharacterized protein n=1 Tax=Triticum urartu TaxID=4572 RepID=M7YZP4_TRIUA|nr:hypothetical protein TRIUR3_03534 [Triticum urartu]